jgi:8-oxo-dGTP diphosphatase
VISISLIQSVSLPDPELTYVVMGSRYRDQWIFVRHRERTSWELPAGHIEPGETADEAAARELREECGASQFKLQAICDYSVEVDSSLEYGRLYYAEIHALSGKLEFEIEELTLSKVLPKNLTYPEVQSLLFDRLVIYLDQEG